jgi:hypothetical protein
MRNMRYICSGDCDAGFYCDRGANVSQPTDGVTGGVCPAGNYCPQGTAVPIPCEDGESQIHYSEFYLMSHHS